MRLNNDINKGYEQANRYKIMDPNGTYLGYILEEEGFAKSVGRQFLGTHRRMNATILNVQGEVVFKVHTLAFGSFLLSLNRENHRL